MREDVCSQLIAVFKMHSARFLAWAASHEAWKAVPGGDAALQFGHPDMQTSSVALLIEILTKAKMQTVKFEALHL